MLRKVHSKLCQARASPPLSCIIFSACSCLDLCCNIGDHRDDAMQAIRKIMQKLQASAAMDMRPRQMATAPMPTGMQLIQTFHGPDGASPSGRLRCGLPPNNGQFFCPPHVIKLMWQRVSANHAQEDYIRRISPPFLYRQYLEDLRGWSWARQGAQDAGLDCQSCQSMSCRALNRWPNPRNSTTPVDILLASCFPNGH